MCCSRNEQALLARLAADATLATRDLPGSDPAHGCHGAAPRRYPSSGHAVRLAIPAGGNRRPTAGLAPCFVQMISPSFLPPTSDFCRRYSRTCAHRERRPAWATARAVHPSRPASLAAQNDGERLGRIARALVEQTGLDQRLTNAHDLRALDLHQRRAHDCQAPAKKAARRYAW